MITLSQISVQFSGEFLFDNVSFIINSRDRIGLVGKNGSGKTTLLRIIVGEMKPENGEVIVPGKQTIGYLPQEMTTNSEKSVLKEAETAFSESISLENRIQKLSEEVSGREDYESADYRRLTEKLAELSDRFQLLGGHSIEANIEKVLLGLGFIRDDFDRPVSEFSHGWQMRIELAKILLSKPELILLDEPTNHLDIDSIQWLEEFLISYPGAVLLVSHDRAFLDNVTGRTVEISQGRIYDYKACYSDFVRLREERLEQQMAAYSNQQKTIRQTERFIERFRYKNTKARQVQSKIKMLDKLEEIEPDELDNSAIHFKFPPAPRSGKVVVEARNLIKSYDERTVLNSIDFSIIRGDKVAFVGKNGEGKTTLSKIIAGELDYLGTVNFGVNVTIGYYAQNQADYLDPEKTVFETVDDIAVGDIRSKLRSLLGAFLFSGESIDKKVKVLSGGEKSRLSIAKLLLSPVNLLILDEPTNHLDMVSKDILKNALIHYDGTLIIVSHDRDFLQGLTNKLYEFKNRRIREYLGDIYTYLESRKISALSELELAGKNLSVSKKQKSENKIAWEKKKKYESSLRKIQTRISKAEQKIEVLENEIAQMENNLSNPEYYSKALKSGEFDSYTHLKNDLDKQMDLWETLQTELEKLKNESS